MRFYRHHLSRKRRRFWTASQDSIGSFGPLGVELSFTTLSVRGWGRRCHFDQAIFETVVNLTLLDVTAVPAVSLFEAHVERGRLKSEDALGFHHHFGDRRHIEVNAEIGGLSHGIAA